jgi:hypothetical protein
MGSTRRREADEVRRAVIGALSILALVPAGSGSPSSQPDLAVGHDFAMPPPFCADGADGGPAPTFDNVQKIFTAHCAVPMCHDASPQAASVMQDLRAGHAYPSIVGVRAAEVCDGGVPLTRVVPGDAGASWLYHKIADDPPCTGGQMPQSEVGAFPLPHCAMEVIRQWIAAGAKP